MGWWVCLIPTEDIFHWLVAVYVEYAKTSNLLAVIIYGFTLLAAQTAQIGGSVWLKKWAEANGDSGGNGHVGKYIGVYFAFGIGSASLVVVQTLILWIFCSIEASRKLHERMVFAMFRSPMTFFETTPAGRILNRFSRYVYLLCPELGNLKVERFLESFWMIISILGDYTYPRVLYPLRMIATILDDRSHPDR